MRCLQAKGKIINGSRVYKNHNGYLLRKSKLGGKSCWVIEDVGEKDETKRVAYACYGNRNVPEEFDWVTLGGGEAPEPIVRETSFSRKEHRQLRLLLLLLLVHIGLQNLDVSNADFQDLE